MLQVLRTWRRVCQWPSFATFRVRNFLIYACLPQLMFRVQNHRVPSRPLLALLLRCLLLHLGHVYARTHRDWLGWQANRSRSLYRPVSFPLHEKHPSRTSSALPRFKSVIHAFFVVLDRLYRICSTDVDGSTMVVTTTPSFSPKTILEPTEYCPLSYLL